MIRFRWFLVCLIIGSLPLAVSIHAAVTINAIKWEKADSRLRCVIQLQAPIQIEQNNLIAEKGLFYVDLHNVQLAKPLEKEMYHLNNPFLRAVRFQLWKEQKVLRVCFWPQQGVKHQVKISKSPSRIDIDLLEAPKAIEKKTEIAKPVPTIAPKGKETPATSLKPEDSETVKVEASSAIPLFSRFMQPAAFKRGSSGTSNKIVVIDPGHGGSRGGADGALKSVEEKDINFQIARRLAGLIKNSPNMRYVMTRTNDSHVGLWDRVQFAEGIAKPGNGECVFVSIHNNWARDPDARGIEFYYFEENPKNKSEALKELERLENDLEYKEDQKLNATLKNIFLSMEQDKLTERKMQGRQLCNMLEWSFNQNSYFRQHNRGGKGATFMVLRNFNMPAVLVEVGFISNREECRLLSTKDFQHNAAVGIFNAINAYFKIQDPDYEPMKYNFR